MTATGFTLFDTAIGACGVAWSERGVVALQLPEAAAAETRARLAALFPSACECDPSPAAQRAIDGVATLLRGEAADLSVIPLDLEGAPPFHRRVYDAARAIPPGATATYGEIARRVGAPGAARAVGQALGRNPIAIIVPCHRVLAAGGKAGGFSANGGVATKLRLLAIEGAAAADGGLPLPSPAAAYGFDPDAAASHVRAADPELARIMDAAGPFAMKLQAAQSVFGSLAKAIVYQQLAGKAAAAIYGRVCALCPSADDGPSAERILRATDEELRAAGLSRPKIAALRDLAQRAAAGGVPTLAEVRGMDDEEIIERLTVVRGVGRWTVEMLLIFRLGRPDVLPLDDYGLRRGFAVAFKLDEPADRKAVEARGERWRPYRTLASWYLWRALEIA